MFQQLILYFLGLSFSLATTCHSWHCDLMSLQEAISIGNVTYRQVCPQLPFKFKPLPFSNDHYLHPYEGIFHETFILHIPNGQVFGADGWVLVKDKLISELIWQNVLPSQWMLQEIKKRLCSDPQVNFRSLARQEFLK